MASEATRLPPSEAVVSALESGDVILANTIATVTTTALIIRDRHSVGHMIVSLQRVSRVRLVSFSYPGLLVLASAIFLLAAAAHFSKQGSGAETPLALVGVAFVLAYWISRKGSVAFFIGAEHHETNTSSVRRANAVISAIKLAQNALYDEDE